MIGYAGCLVALGSYFAFRSRRARSYFNEVFHFHVHFRRLIIFSNSHLRLVSLAFQFMPLPLVVLLE